jgi:hypothetical protein
LSAAEIQPQDVVALQTRRRIEPIRQFVSLIDGTQRRVQQSTCEQTLRINSIAASNFTQTYVASAAASTKKQSN